MIGRIGLRVVVVLLLGTLLAGAWLFGTSAGTRVVIAYVSGLTPNLKLRHESGTLFGPLHLRKVVIETRRNDLVIDDLVIDWSPACLLVGSACLRDVSARQVELRLSAAPPPAAAAGAPRRGPPSLRLPLELDAGRISVARFDIVQGAQRTRFEDVEAALNWDGDALRIDRLALAMPGWQASASGTLTTGGDWPVDALLQFRLPRAGEPTLQMHGHASGTLVNLVLDAGSSGVLAARLHGTLQLFEPRLPLRATLQAERIDLPSAQDSIVQLTAVQLAASGTLLERLTVEGNAQLATPWLPVLPASLSATGDWRGIRDGTLHLAHPQLDARLALQAGWIGARSFRADATVNQLDLGLFNPALRSRLAGRVGLDGALAGDATEVRILVENLAGSVARHPAAARGELRWQASQLHFRRFVLQQGDNRATLDGTLDRQWSVDAELDFTNLATLQQGLAGSVAGTARIDGAAADPEVGFTVQARRLQTPAATLPAPLAAEVRLPVADWQLAGSANRRRLLLAQASTVGGDFRVEASGTVDWRAHLEWDISSNLQQFPPGRLTPLLAGRVSGPLRVRGDYAQQLRSLQLDTQLEGTLDGRALQAQASLAYTPARSELGHLQLVHGDNRLDATGQLDEDRVALQLSVQAPQLADSFRDLSGNLEAQASVAGARQAPDLQLQLDAGTLRLQDLRLDRLQANVQLAEGGDADSRADLTVTGLQRTGLLPVSGSLHVTGTRAQHGIGLQVEQAPALLALSAGGSLDGDHWQGTLRHGDARWRNWRWQASSEPELAIQDRELRLAPHCWSDGEARACFTAPARLGRSGTLQAEAFHLPAGRLLADLLPLDTDISGGIGGTVSAQWRDGIIEQLLADIRNGEPLQFQTAGDDGRRASIAEVERVHAVAAIDDQDTRLRASLAGAQVGAVEFQASIMPGDGALSGHLRADNINAGLAGILTYQWHDIGGVVNADIDLNGTASAPRVSGSASLVDGRASMVRMPLAFEGIRLDGRFDGEQAQLEGRFRTPESREDVQVDGNFRLQGRRWQGSATARGKSLALALPPQYQFTTAPDLLLELDGNRVELSGEVVVPSGRIDIKGLPSQSVSLSQDVVIVEQERERQQRAPLFERYADVNFTLGRDIRFKAFGAQGNLTGNLRLRSKPQFPLQVTGELAVIDGTYSAFGQTLALRQTGIIFNGPADQPLVDATAVREIEDGAVKEVGLRLTGSLRAPETTLWSTPELPQGEALSWLVTGRAQLAGNLRGDAAQAAMSLGIAQGSAILSQAGQQLGLHDFQLSANSAADGEDTEVQVGTSLNERVFVGYNRRVFSGEESLLLRLYMTRRLMLEAVSGVESALDVFYTFEF